MPYYHPGPPSDPRTFRTFLLPCTNGEIEKAFTFSRKHITHQGLLQPYGSVNAQRHGPKKCILGNTGYSERHKNGEIGVEEAVHEATAGLILLGLFILLIRTDKLPFSCLIVSISPVHFRMLVDSQLFLGIVGEYRNGFHVFRGVLLLPVMN